MIDKTTIINAAQKLAGKGQIDKAIAEWEKLLENAADGNIHNTIGDLYLKKGTEKEAIEAYAKAAEIFRKDGFYPKAIALYKKILNLVPNEVDSLIALARLNAEKNLIGNAVENYFKAAEIYHREGSIEKAAMLVEKILQLSPTDVTTRKKIAYLYFRLGMRERAANEYAAIGSDFLLNNDLKNAGEAFNQSIEFDPENIQALIGLSTIAGKTNNIDKAFEYLNGALSYDPDNRDILFSYALLAQQNDRLEDSKNMLLAVIDVHPSDHAAKKMLGDIYINEGSHEDAWEILLPSIDDMLEAGNWVEAHELLHKFKDICSIPVKGRLLKVCRNRADEDTICSEIKGLAELHENAKSYEEALELYREALELGPYDETLSNKVRELEMKLGIEHPAEEAPEAKLSTADILVSSDISPQTDKEYCKSDHAIIPGPENNNEQTPVSGTSLTEKKAEADFFARAGLRYEALAIYEELLSYDPDNEEILNNIKTLKAVPAGAEEIALENLHDTVPEVSPDLSSVDADLTNIFAQFENSDKEKEAEDYEARYQAGLEYRQKGLLDDAIREFQVAARNPEKMVRNTTMLAMCYMGQGSYTKAITEFSKVLGGMSPADATYLHVKYELAGAYMNNKEDKMALELYSEIHAQNSEFKDVSEKINSLQPQSRDDKPSSKRNRVSYI